MRWKVRQIMVEFHFAITAAFALLFFMSGGSKVFNINSFQNGVREYRILPPGLVAPFAWMAALTELAGAVLVLTPASQFAGAALASLLCTYVIAIGLNLKRGATINCHCFEALGSSRLTWVTMFRALFVLGGCLVLAVRPSVWSNFRNAEPVPFHWYEFAGYLVLLAIFFVLFEVLQKTLETGYALQRRGSSARGG